MTSTLDLRSSPDPLETARKLAIGELWRRGDLYYKLHATQRAIYDRIRYSGSRQHFICCSRRLGKSFMLVCLAFETALRKPNSRILYLAPFGQDALKIVQDLSDYLLPDCPSELQPQYRTQDREFRFPNGSTIRFRGVNGERAEFLRGGAADLVVLDECGSMDALESVYKSVVLPMTLTTRGLVIMATTPAITTGHDSKALADDALRDGVYYEYTLRDAPHISDTEKLRILVTFGEDAEHAAACLRGEAEPKTTKARREFWCKWVTDSGSAVVPEFDAEARSEIVRVTELPAYYDAYTAMDPGMVDNTGVLFAHFDARTQKLVIEDEWLARHAGTPTIAEAIRSKEKERWGEKTPYLRVSDRDLRLISDLTVDHRLPFIPAPKNDSAAALWNMRQMVKNRSLVIHPRCANLIRQLETATMNKKGTDFADEVVGSSEDKVIAHFDLVAALKYLCRVVNFQRNPYPEWHLEHRGVSAHRRSGLGKASIRVQTPAAKRLEARERSGIRPKPRRR